MEPKGYMFHARVYPGTKEAVGMGSPYMKGKASSDKVMTPKGELHERVYPGKMAAVDGGSPYVNRKGAHAAPSGDNPKCKGKANQEASSDPLAIRTGGFA